ncbi:uncharacterized protein BP5553_04719 [Venustampulla echinocandica]|uniref:Uncharacterized protein n=1 Tax=Venustampulla echinocandica TaxID=2656787 RepID=A0A370TP33_9HELO|nr:uncharacterized protein BP5553_04719 [Venustampulla echinocandica]RDL37286.1 hypothetical protein BP5553_04719 [Venustampulla echinocandica]
MVTLFFVISGYVLSYSALKKIRSRQAAQLLDSLASSVFRRWLRLFLPLIVSTFITVIFVRMGWVDDALATRVTLLPGPLPSRWAQIKDWWTSFILLSNTFMGMDEESVYADQYGSQLWTIPREFRGSIVVYVTLLGLAKTRQTFHVLSVIAFSLYALYIAQWDIYLFLSGMALAEIQFIYNEARQNNASSLQKYIPRAVKRHRKGILYIVTTLATLLAIHFLTIPDEGLDSAPGYGWMLANTPLQYGSVSLRQKFWLCLGAPLLCLAMIFSPPTSSNPSPIPQ